MIFLVLLVVLLGSGDVMPVFAEQPVVNGYVFEREGCPYCAQALEHLHQLAAQAPRIVIHEFDVVKDPEHRELFFAFGDKFGFEPQYVPTIFIGSQYWVGYNNTIQAEMDRKIQQCLATPCVDEGMGILREFGLVDALSPGEPVEGEVPPDEESSPVDESAFSITLPLIGQINLADQSLLLSTLLISFVDGFNPCSIWVLSMLLAITLNTRSRKKVLIIGFVFITVTAIVYALFIGGLFTVFTFIGYVGWIQLVVALIALVFALVNIKDYFWYKEGLSFTISDKQKPGIYKGIRRIMNAEENIWGLISATVVMAAGVSLVEFSCTAGFPMVWTNLLAFHEVTGLAFLGFLLVYMLVYQLDEMGIFLVAVFTLRKSKMEEKYGRILKLLGGILMLALAIVMLVDPTLMNQIGSSLWVFGAAFGLTGLILLVHQVILPRIK
jgi:cytochrome c biogenesis protein CcdA/glutaredoxin